MPNLRYAHTIARFIDRPLLVLPRHAMAMWNSMSTRFGLEAGALPEDHAAELIDQRFAVVSTTPQASRFAGEYTMDEGGRRVQPFKLAAGGVGILSVVGELVNRGAWVGANSGLVSYEGLKFQLDRLRDDNRVSSVILDIDSPGGEAVGFELAAGAIQRLAQEKPVIAVVNGMAASGGYALASAASEIVVSETSITGSIGVIMMHLDVSRALDEAGITPTLIFTGDHKADGNSFEPLPENVRGDLQAEADAFYDAFIKIVTKGRQGRTTAKDARATQARTFIGKEAIDAKLADQVGSFEDVLAALARNPRNRRNRMTQSNRRAAADNGLELGADIQVPVIEFGGEQFADVSALVTEQRRVGAANLATRINEVLADERSNGRERFAIALATENPDMKVERVLELTAMSAKAEPAAKPPATPPLAERQKDTGADQLDSIPLADPKAEADAAPAQAWAKITDGLNARIG